MGRSWTFGRKLGAGFALIVLLSIIMGAIGYYALRIVVEEKDRVMQNAGQDLIDAEHLRASLHREVAGIRGLLLSYDQGRVAVISEADQEFAAALGRIRARERTKNGRRLLANIEEAESTHQRAVDGVLARLREGADRATLASDYDEQVEPALSTLLQEVRTFVAESERERDVGRQLASGRADTAKLVLVGTGIGIVLLAIAIALVLTRTLGGQIGGSVNRIRSSSTELQAAATQQASAAREQATAMSEITTTIGELLASSRQIAESGQHVATMAADSAASARSGAEAVGRARDAVTSIQQQVDTIVEHMLDLGRKSQQVGGIIEIINELSEQTNILAINATIEASGAGESGRRFAVVAEEIRKLADRVGHSTREIRSLIEDIRSAVNSSVMATEAGSKTVEGGAQRFEELEQTFSAIDELVGSTMAAGREIELSTKQQSSAVEQVNVAISNVAQATNETETSSQQTLQTASELSGLSDDLASLVRADSA